MSGYAATTTVSSEKSRAEIEQTIRRWKGTVMTDLSLADLDEVMTTHHHSTHNGFTDTDCLTCVLGWRLDSEARTHRALTGRIRDLITHYEQVREQHLGPDDCGCEVDDCYDCGCWHNCHHSGPPARTAELTALLDPPGDTTTTREGT